MSECGIHVQDKATVDAQCLDTVDVIQLMFTASTQDKATVDAHCLDTRQHQPLFIRRQDNVTLHVHCRR